MSNFYLDFIEDHNGDLVDINYYHRECAPYNIIMQGGWPCPSWPDYDVYCANSECQELIHKGDTDE